MDLIECGKCGMDLSGLANTGSGKKYPCPKCSSTIRHTIPELLESEASSTDYLSGTTYRNGRIIGFGETHRQDRSASADRENNGSLSYSLTGTSPQGEDDTCTVCGILINKLNTLGDSWEKGVEGKKGTEVDWETKDSQNQKLKLKIQVVRALIDRNFWKELSKKKQMDRKDIPVRDLADQLEKAIKHKVCSYASSNRQELVLALDATRLPVFVFDDVVDDFRRRYGDWSGKQGFKCIWLIGPDINMTRILSE